MKYGCIAQRLGHSFSKEIHAHLADYSYELCEIAPENLDSFMKSRDFCGINVTIPYKQAVIPYLDEISDTARKIGAVNTIVNRNGKLYGYNTDFFGMSSLIRISSMSPKGKKALILGSGGTSKTAMAVLKEMGAREIYKVSRSAHDGTISYNDAMTKHSDAEFIVNTTPVGMYPDIAVSPIDLNAFTKLEAVVDAIYNPLRSRLVSNALEKNIRAVGGLYMLVAQAARACELFIDTKISDDKIFEVYKEIFKKTENIVLIGMPSSGKTTVGKAVAKALDMNFVDCDEEIVKSEDKAISDIFAEKGEPFFRQLEADMLKKLSAMKNTVIATGGGAVLNPENIRLLRENGRIYFLDRSLDSLLPTQDRPTANSREALKKRYSERYPIYCSSCDVHIMASDKVEENALKITKDFLK
jgi:shikimate dehydrogenase